MNQRSVGNSYEEKAVQYLKDKHLTILERNYHIRQGEIDIIARDGEELVFVEVKYRKNSNYGYPEEAVTLRKQQRICKAASHYCYTRRIEGQVRYDVISICGEEISWYQNAFNHIGFG